MWGKNQATNVDIFFFFSDAVVCKYFVQKIVAV